MLQKSCLLLLSGLLWGIIVTFFSIPILIALFITFVSLFVATMMLFARLARSQEIPTLELKREASPGENLSGKILYETDLHYLVKFSTFSRGHWEELIPKHSEEIKDKYNVKLIPMSPTIYGD